MFERFEGFRLQPFLGQSRLGQKLLQIGRRRLPGSGGGHRELGRAGVILPADGHRQLAEARTGLIEEQDPEHLGYFRDTAHEVDGLVADILGLVGDTLEHGEHDEDHHHGPPVDAVVLREQLLVDRVHFGFDALGHLHQHNGAVGVAVAKSPPRFGQDHDRFVGQFVKPQRKLFRQRPVQLQRFAAHRNGVIADPLQRDIHPDRGRHLAQVPRARQEARNEHVAKAVAFARLPIDGVIAQHGFVSELFIPQHQRLFGIAQRGFHVIADLPQPFADVVQIGFHTFFQMAHDRSWRFALKGSGAAAGLQACRGRRPGHSQSTLRIGA